MGRRLALTLAPGTQLTPPPAPPATPTTPVSEPPPETPPGVDTESYTAGNGNQTYGDWTQAGNNYSFPMAQADRAVTTVRPSMTPQPFNAWPSVLTFPSARNTFAQYLFCGLLAKYAYVTNNAILQVLKDTIGAQSVTSIPIDGTTNAPGGIVVEYSDVRIFVIQGTTTEYQLAMQTTGTREVMCTFGSSGYLQINNEGQPIPGDFDQWAPDASLRNSKFWAGIYWKPYVVWGNQWFVRVLSHYASDGKKCFVIGHSAGAAVAEVVGNIISRYIDRNGEMLSGANQGAFTTASAIRELGQNGWDGGMVFGQPRVCSFRYYHADYDASNAQLWHEPGKPWHIDVRHARATQAIKSVCHPRDPISVFPAPMGNAIGALSRVASSRELGKNTYAVNPAGCLGVRNNVVSFSWGGDLMGLKKRFENDVANFHPIEKYILHLTGKAYDLMGEAPSGWASFIASTASLTVDNELPPNIG